MMIANADQMFAEAMRREGRGFGAGGAGLPPATAAEQVRLPAKSEPRALREGDIYLGQSSNGDMIGIHLGKLIEGRLLIQGNSGAGKSMLLRRIFEQAFGRVQQLLIDPEGEFSTLAEILDVAVLGADEILRIGGRAFALHMREHRYSAILDLSDASAEDRFSIVADLTQGLIDASSEHWNSLLVLIDEAQTIVPHYDTGDVDAETRKRVIISVAEMMSRGRKRGIGGVIATGRVAETAKSVVAKTTNVIVGRTVFDRDLERAGAALGFTAGHSRALRTLADGEFLGIGPALAGPSRVRFKAGPVQSRHKGKAPAIVKPPSLSAADAVSLLSQVADAEVLEAVPGVPSRGRQGRNWTLAEDKIVRDGYAAGKPVRDIANELVTAGYRSASLSTVSTRAHALGLISVRAATVWTDEEDEIIRDAYLREVKLMDIVGLLAEAGFERGRVSVQMRAIALGITRDRVNYWTEPEKAIVIAGLENGTPYREIIQNLKAAGYERGNTSIFKFAQRHGYSRKSEGWTPDEIEKLHELYEKKMPVKEISEILGKPIAGIRTRASNLGLKQRVAWSEREYEILREAQERGDTLTHAAQLIGRPYPNVARVAATLRLDFSRKRAAQ